MILTIAIPSFDRPAELRRTIALLVPQLTDEVEVIVLDNASATPATESLAEFLDVRIRVIRNTHNIGANGNILRCIELASAPWVWVLGDDDTPQDGAVALAVAAVRQTPDALAINFNSAHGAGPQAFSTVGRADLIDRLPSFGNLLFISTNLLRRAPLVEHLHIGYRFAYAMASHLSMLLMAAGSDGKVVFRDEVLVGTETVLDGRHWSAINQALSIPTLLELPLTPHERKRLATRFQLPDLANLLFQLLGTGVRRGEFASSKYYYGQITARMWPYSSISKRAVWTIGRVAFLFPKLSLLLANRALKMQKGSSVMARLRAETFDPRG